MFRMMLLLTFFIAMSKMQTSYIKFQFQFLFLFNDDNSVVNFLAACVAHSSFCNQLFLRVSVVKDTLVKHLRNSCYQVSHYD